MVPMQEYNKIPTLFNRDPNNKKKVIFNSFSSPTIESLSNIEWQFTEKIDGTNVRIHWDGHKVAFGGRTDDAEIPVPLYNKLSELFLSEGTEELFEQKFGESSVTLYGEGYGPKIQKGGGLYRSDVSFILFDVAIHTTDYGWLYLTRESVEDIANYFNLEIVPIILTGTISEGVDFVLKHPKSTIGEAYMEGLVGKPKVEVRDRLGKRVIVKIKWKDLKDFAEVDEEGKSRQTKLQGF